MARYPNMIKNSVPKEKNNYVKRTIHDNKFRSIGFDNGDIPYIEDRSNLQVYLWPGEEEGFCWHQNTMLVTNIDYNDHVLEWNEDTNFGIGRNCRYFLQGALELLDEPGEFYLDRINNTLYYWPYDECNLENGSIIAPKVDSLLLFKGSSKELCASGIVFDGFTIRYSDIMDCHNYLKHGYGLIYLENATGISILNCDIQNSGWHGVQLFGYAQNNLISGNFIHNIGHTGIQMEDLPRGGLGPYINKSNTITNNYISIVGELVGHASCMELIDSGDNLISHNKMEYAPRYCIGISSMTNSVLEGKTAQDGRIVTHDNVKEYQHTRYNVIQYNDLSKANMDTQDTGVLETWCPGDRNVLHSNAIHDSNLYFSFGTGLYLDDVADNFTVSNNIIYNLQKEGKGVLGCAICAKGIGTHLFNNVVADNNVAEKGGVIGTTDMARKRENHDLSIYRNIFYNSSNSVHTFSNWDDDRYSYCDFNMFYHFGQECGVRGAQGNPQYIPLEEWQSVLSSKFDQYSLQNDPKFVDGSNFDYRLRYDSPAYIVGFEDIEFEKIGLTEDYLLGDKEDDLDKLYLKTNLSNSKSFVCLDTLQGQSAQIIVSGRSQKGYYLKNLNGYQISYESSNNGIATVDREGNICPKSEGVVEITVSAKKGEIVKKAKMHAIVNDCLVEIQCKLPKVHFIPGENAKTHTIGKTKYGRYVDMKGIATFESSDEGIAQIDASGTINLYGEGTVIVTVRAMMGEVVCEEKICVHVHGNLIQKVDVSLEKTILKEGQDVGLIINGVMKDNTPINLSQCEVDVQTSDDQVIQFMEGRIYAKRSGEAEVLVRISMNGEVFKRKCKIKVYYDEGLRQDFNIFNYGNTEGTASFSAGKFILMSNGDNIWFKEDDFTLVGKKMPHIDEESVTVEAKLISIVETSSNAQAGIMIRGYDTDNSSHVNLRVNNNGGVMIAYRGNCGDYISSVGEKQVKFPVYLKLVKKGRQISAYYKEDSVSIGQNMTWVECSKFEIDIGDDFIAGLAAFSNNKSMSTEAVYSDVQIY